MIQPKTNRIKNRDINFLLLNFEKKLLKHQSQTIFGLYLRLNNKRISVRFV